MTMHLKNLSVSGSSVAGCRACGKAGELQGCFNKGLLLAFLKHLETAKTSPERGYAPASVNNLRRSLLVWLQVMVAYDPQENEISQEGDMAAASRKERQTSACGKGRLPSSKSVWASGTNDAAGGLDGSAVWAALGDRPTKTEKD